MARSDAVWGIDIGQCALKALRLRPHEDPALVVADAFDYIEYPKILSQPEADPVALVQDALKEFLSRNSVRGDRVAVSVPGQSGLARFIKLPPVESKKIPDIVKYEARQQIPFALEDVVWDYQKMVGGSEEEGFALETEVGLFAMKRDQVYRSLKPFTDAGIEVDVVQLTPLALYNYVAFDQLQDLPSPAEYDPDQPPPSLVVLSLGTDSTDLVVTNGFRVWQRSIPLGGSHFTKALTKELKLTFATAEHLKRNAAKAEDPKALFQAMRPVFNDLLTEVQRSIGYFTNLDRRAKIGRVLALGNAMKLPGLQRYLGQNLGFEFNKVESFRGLSGAAVVDAPAFKENLLSFGVCYGLALQGLRAAKIKTNLLPREITKDRMIRAKKPWAVGAAAALLMGCTISYFGYWRAWKSVLVTDYFAPAVAKADSVVKRAKDYSSAFDSAKGEFKKTGDVSQSLTLSEQRRQRWIELWKAVNLCLPRDAGERPEKIADRNEINITSLQPQHVDDLATWYTSVEPFDKPEGGAAPAPAADAAAPDAAAAAAPADAAAGGGPTGPGWVIELTGHHYHNVLADTQNQADLYVRKTLLKNLKSDKLPIPEEERVEGGPTEIDLKKLGIAKPVLIGLDHRVDWKYQVPAPDAGDEPADGEAPAAAQPGQNRMLPAPRFDFTVQFCWQDEPPAPAEVPADALPPPDGAAAPEPGTAPEPGAVPGDAPPAAVPPDGAVPPGAQPDAPAAEGAPATPPEGAAPAATEPAPPTAEGAPPAAPGAAPPATEPAPNS